MPIDPKSIEVGQYYAANNNQVRKVLEINGDQLRYVARGKMFTTKWQDGLWLQTTKNNFASEVDRQVTCDWEPDNPS